MITLTANLLPLASYSSSSTPVDPFAAFPIGIFAIAMAFNLLIMIGCSVGGYYVARKYGMQPWIGAVAGFFLGWMGILIVWLIGYTTQQNRKREEEQRQYAQWWQATYGQQQQQQQQVVKTPYGWPGQQQPPQPPQV